LTATQSVRCPRCAPQHSQGTTGRGSDAVTFGNSTQAGNRQRKGGFLRHCHSPTK